MKKYILLSALVLGIIACSKKSVPTTNQTTTPVVTAEDAALQKGKDLVSINCVKCHKEPIPADHSIERWNKVLPNMFNKAHITDSTQQKLIHDYVYSNLK